MNLWIPVHGYATWITESPTLSSSEGNVTTDARDIDLVLLSGSSWHQLMLRTPCWP